MNLDPEAWAGYKEMRLKIRKPMTKRAETLAFRKLEVLMAKGYDPNEVLDQSTFNSWQGLFPVKQNKAIAINDSSMQDTIARLTDRSWANEL